MLLKMLDNIVLLPEAWILTIELVLSLLLPLGLLLAERGIYGCCFLSVLSFLWHLLKILEAEKTCKASRNGVKS
ncbi:hypothetical protein C2U68_07645 [Methylomonas koyamae]|nr:hypothetical protein C2U68_07645 [Methylomonas koyamae]